jgi:hypothetical protein
MFIHSNLLNQIPILKIKQENIYLDGIIIIMDDTLKSGLVHINTSILSM